MGMKSPLEFDRNQLEQLDKEALIAIILMLQEQVGALQHKIGELAAEHQAVRVELAKDSRNSSKPPSSDGLKKARPRNLRRKTGRQSGGQKGHAGHTLEMIEQPDHVTVHSVSACPHCAVDLQSVSACGCERRQVFDVPPVQVEVTEHQAEIKVCPRCGRLVKADFPADVSQPVQYGLRIKAQASYLNDQHLLPLARTCQVLGDLYGHTPAQALILEANTAVAAEIAPSLQAIKQQLIAADVVHFDESGLRVAGRLNWLHVASTGALTYYAVHPKRGQAGMRAIGILPAFRGRAIHDHWLPYFAFTDCRHALCNAHHLRELLLVVEQYAQPWAEEMIHLLLDIKAEVDLAPAAQWALPPDRLAHFEQQYDACVEHGLAANPLPTDPPTKKRGRKKQTPPRNLLDRLQHYKAQVLAFMYDFRVPFNNNLVERDIRMVKTKQKVSGCFRTLAGAETFCAIRSYISTARKHGLNVIDALYDALTGHPFIPCTLSTVA
jgi:transposase